MPTVRFPLQIRYLNWCPIGYGMMFNIFNNHLSSMYKSVHPQCQLMLLSQCQYEQGGYITSLV